MLDDDTDIRKDFKHDLMRDDENIIKTQFDVCCVVLSGDVNFCDSIPLSQKILLSRIIFLASIFSTFPLIFHSFHIFPIGLFTLISDSDASHFSPITF